MTSNYVHHEIFPLGADATPYRLLTTEHVRTRQVDGREILEVDAPGADACSPTRRCATSSTCCAPATSPSCARSSTTRKPRPTTASSPSSC